MSLPRPNPPPPLARPPLARLPLAWLPLARLPLAWLPLALLLAACQAGSTAGQGGTPTALRDLHGVAELEQAFNADAGKPRLILLLSPT